MNDKAVERHAKNHIQPMIAEANEAAKAEFIGEIVQYRREVHMPILDKVKMLQHKIIEILADGYNNADRTALFRELRGTIDLEAKLTGSYQKERTNEGELDRIVEAYRLIESGWPNATAAERDDWLKHLSLHTRIPVDAIRRQIKIQEIDGVQ